MITNDRGLFHNLRDGQLPPAGNRAFGRDAHLSTDVLKRASAGEVSNSRQNENGATGGGEVVREIEVLKRMQAAERGLVRAQAAREKVGLAAYAEILGSIKLRSVEQIDNLKTLQEIVMALEQKVVPRS